MIVSWFSAGVSSAIATKLAIEKYGDIKVFYNTIDDQHPDSERFLSDVERWLNINIERIDSPYKSVENVVRQFRFINSPRGAKCSQILKHRPRREWEELQRDKNPNVELHYIWGLDKSEQHRADRFSSFMPGIKHEFPLIDNGIEKEVAHELLRDAGIARPKMYELGFPNNNCIGCVKGGRGYWNAIREHFPEVFKKRAELEREIKRSCINGVFLDELEPDTGRMLPVTIPDCGMFCFKEAAE